MSQATNMSALHSAKHIFKFTMSFCVVLISFLFLAFLLLSRLDAPRFLLAVPGTSLCDYVEGTDPDACGIHRGSRQVQKVLWPWQSCEQLRSMSGPRVGCCLQFK